MAKSVGEAIAAAMAIIDQAFGGRIVPPVPVTRPRSLFHFTDLAGFEGIHENKTLWASHVASLNDPSESVHGRRRAKQFLEEHQGESPKEIFARRVLHLLDPANAPPEVEVDVQPYVVSFCARKDGAIHWLAYGRAGTGLAIEFDPTGLIPADGESGEGLDVELAPVIYRQAQQRQLFADLLEAIWVALPRARAELDDRHDERFLELYAAHSTAVHMNAAAAMMKKYAFRDEREWRLITHDVFGSSGRAAPHKLPTKLRKRGGGVVAYKPFPFPPASLVGVEVGWSFPMMRTRGALRPLTAHYGVPFRRSTVPIRPTSG